MRGRLGHNYWDTLTLTTETLSHILMKHSYIHYWNALTLTTETLTHTYILCTPMHAHIQNLIHTRLKHLHMHAWVFQIDTYKCFTCMHVSISYVCVYDTEVCMYACVFLICMCKCFRLVCIMFYIWACIGLQSMYVCVSVSVVSVRAFQ